jgi:hypothetical protein
MALLSSLPLGWLACAVAVALIVRVSVVLADTPTDMS